MYMNSEMFKEEALALISRFINESEEFDKIKDLSPVQALDLVKTVLGNVNAVILELEEIKYVLNDAEDELDSSVRDLQYSTESMQRAIEKIREQF